MDVHIEPLKPADRARATAALVEAFMADPLFNFLIPKERQRRRWLPHCKGELIRQTLGAGEGRIAVDGAGEVVGAMSAGPYPPKKLHDLLMMLRTTLLPYPWEPDFRPMSRVFKYMSVWDQMHWKDHHRYVYTIGVIPRYQGKGIGRRLMAECIRLSKSDGVPVYLETQTASNVPFYESLGFAVTESHAPFPDGPSTWGMIRKPLG